MTINLNIIGPNFSQCKKAELDSETARAFLKTYMDQLETSLHPVSKELTEEVTIRVILQEDVQVASAAERFDLNVFLAEKQ